MRGMDMGSGGVAGAVLAGGASRRMGRDKATLPVGGTALARLALAAVAAVADPVALVAPAGHPAATLAAPSLRVADPGRGPLAALAATLRALDAEHVLVVAGDHPGLRVELLRRLAAERAGAAAVACRRATGVEPLVAVYERAPALALAEARVAAGADRSLRGLLAALGARVLDEAEWRPLDPDGSSFVDLDDPGDLAAWESGRWRRSAPGHW
ncbi:MAG TPA: NTP transferase domain-containing protein [Actinomycetota bacterium]|nr:NTP transferase domain-containing protein [Actinomycetota bacterium]